ncbi:hypothetical protein K461DRAFT_282581 [Myriangium duriaei CBS 260.36]|uniref:Peptidase A1 domain-containing protein n=1 Tax=Myriangium duriaei CBS 260.36 TaxID=1168546 RepID=A0A9P4IVB8_9PEZI|nr:hypothetical protein K461DRAFT_282581 [Myriangium duriaei CBS 260.36]
MISQFLLALGTLSATGVVASPLNTRSGDPSKLYHGLTSHAVIPFAHGSDFGDSGLHLRVTVNGKHARRNATVDTGSTAFLVGGLNYPNFNATVASLQKQGVKLSHEYLSSSGNVYSGYLKNVTVHFLDATPKNTTAFLEALLVTDMVKCNNYNSTIGGACPDSQINKTAPFCHNNCEQMYMGVGFGRSADGQSDFTPANNAFLQVDHIGGKHVNKTTFVPGYTITRNAITVGIAQANSADYKLVKLNHTDSGLPLDWQEVTGSVSITQPGSETARPAVLGQFLLDTGVTKSFLDLPPSSGITKSQSLLDGTTVSIVFGEIDSGKAARVATYSYTVGKEPNGPTSHTDKGDISFAHNRVLPDSQSLAFVNTGVHFYRTNDILFDAKNGYWGVRKHKVTYA